MITLALALLVARRPQPQFAKIDPAIVRIELVDLDRQASLHETTANAMLQERPKRAAPPSEPVTNPRRKRDTAALILVYEADRYAKSNRPAAAIAAYRRAIELFPRTHWGEVARQRLKEMQT